jgi:hypothetical protein
MHPAMRRKLTSVAAFSSRNARPTLVARARVRRAIPFDDEVDVIALDRKVNDSEVRLVSRRQRLPHGREHSQ